MPRTMIASRLLCPIKKGGRRQNTIIQTGETGSLVLLGQRVTWIFFSIDGTTPLDVKALGPGTCCLSERRGFSVECAPNNWSRQTLASCLQKCIKGPNSNVGRRQDDIQMTIALTITNPAYRRGYLARGSMVPSRPANSSTRQLSQNDAIPGRAATTTFIAGLDELGELLLEAVQLLKLMPD